MPIQIPFSPSDVADIKTILGMEESDLEKVIDQLSLLNPIPLQPELLLGHLQSLEGISEDNARSLLKQGLSLNSLMLRADISLKEVIEGIGFQIRQHDDLDIKIWVQKQATFQRLIESRVFNIVVRSINLSYEYTNLYQSGRLLTDIRPLFSQDAKGIEGAVVSYTLRLRYDNSSGAHDLSIAMDEKDVKALEEQCSRGLIKAKTAKSAMGKLQNNIPIIITGESK